MKTIIAGQREIDGVEVNDMALVEAAMKAAADRCILPTAVVCGMARGVDSLGKAWAEAHDIPVIEMPAQWQRPDGSTDRGAGFKRNKEMAQVADAAVIIYGGSKGSADMIEQAHIAKLHVYVHHLKPPEKSEIVESGQDPATSGHPKTVNTTRRVNGELYVAGEGPREENGKPKQSDIMFVAASVLEEEARETQELNVSGGVLKSKARYLKGASGAILKDLLLGVSIDIKECYYTALCKWLLPRQTRLKPPKSDCDAALPALLEEIKEVQPKIIVCFGKPAFDALVPYKISLKDAKGAWFTSDKAPGAKIYVLEDPTKLLTKAEYVEKFRADFLEVARLRDHLKGVITPQIPLHYSVIRNFTELCTWVAKMKEEKWKLFSVDCEWGHHNHVDGKLRSIQFCWAPGYAVYVRFRAPKGDTWVAASQDVEVLEAQETTPYYEQKWADEDEYVFDVSYETAGAVLGSLLNEPDIFYIGHHASADFPWMNYWLNLDYWDKCVLDTEFATQCVNEHLDLGLERVALQYTPFGRYDIGIIIGKKANPGKINAATGYTLIPDEGMIPYGCRDVDTPMRAYAPLVKALQDEDMWTYYSTIFGPFVTSIFTDFTLQGLLIDKDKIDELRDLYAYAKEELTAEFRKLVHEESKQLLLKYLMEIARERIPEAVEAYQEALTGDQAAAWGKIKALVPKDGLPRAEAFWSHYVESPLFNIRSQPMMVRWLFITKGLTPVKSTGNREKGIPSVSWDKVLTYSEARQKEFKPSTDKQTLQILGEQDGLVSVLLDLNAVGNVSKAFLKPADIDPDTGETVKENGLHFWLASDGRIHGMWSATESSRCRSWNPNSLNWPSWVNARITNGIGNLLKLRQAQGCLPTQFQRYLNTKIPSIRSVVIAGEGNVFCEDDYVTAELVAWAVISGDKNMIRLLTEPDDAWGFARLPGSEEPQPVRIRFREDTAISVENQKSEYLMAVWKEGEKLADVKEVDLIRNEDGTIQHPCPYDLHWDIAESVYRTPREMLKKKKDRDGLGKPSNFSTAYGTTAETLERKIEQESGVKPLEGTGQLILDALENRQPQAFMFMLEQETLPESPGFYRCASGRVRHFVKDKLFLASLDYRSRKSLLSRLARESRNIPMQESVGATAARACVNTQRYYRDNGMAARVSICLYDSVVSCAPLNERFEVARLHRKFMCEENTWQYEDRILRYQVDQDMVDAWSWSPTTERRKMLRDVNWMVDNSQAVRHTAES